jgi:hypothetical protein
MDLKRALCRAEASRCGPQSSLQLVGVNWTTCRNLCSRLGTISGDQEVDAMLDQVISENKALKSVGPPS